MYSISEADYDGNRRQLKEFMKNQDTFKDLDFEMNGIGRIISLLAQDNHYSNFYANAAFKESFLDTAMLRASVVSKAKERKYIPRSIRAARATVDIHFQNGEPIDSELTLPKGTRLSGRNIASGTTKDFVVSENHTITANANDLVFSNVQIVQGSYQGYDFTVDKYTNSPFYTLPSDNIDTTFLEVYVQSNFDSSKFDRYYGVNDIYNTDKDKIYYLQEGPDGRYQIYFSDRIFSEILQQGSVIRTIFLKTDGPDGNFLDDFNFTTTNDSFFSIINQTYSSIYVGTVTQSDGGAEREDIESIRFNSMQYRGDGNNALRNEDYAVRAQQLFPQIKSIRVWDASRMKNPAGSVGKIFMSIVPFGDRTFTQAEKDEIASVMNNQVAGSRKCIELVDPEYLYVKLNSSVYQDEQSKYTRQFLRETIKNSILNYASKELVSFNSWLKRSELGCLIDGVDSSIDSNITNITLEKRLASCTGQSKGYVSSFENGVVAGTFRSNNQFVSGTEVYMRDDEEQNINLYDSTNGSLIQSKVGKVDYASGNFEIFPIIFTSPSLEQAEIRLSAVAKNTNIETEENTIIRILEEDIVINIINKENNLSNK